MTDRIIKRLAIESRGYTPYAAAFWKVPPEELKGEKEFHVLTYNEHNDTYCEHIYQSAAYWGEYSTVVGYAIPEQENKTDDNDDDLDVIINPDHYRTIPAGNYPNGIQYMGIVAFLLTKKQNALDHYEAHMYSQIMKYSLRLGEKDKTLQDMKKIKWYVDLFILYNEVKLGNKDLRDFVAQWEIVNKKVED
jgi:hypothetical protein